VPQPSLRTKLSSCYRLLLRLRHHYRVARISVLFLNQIKIFQLSLVSRTPTQINIQHHRIEGYQKNANERGPSGATDGRGARSQQYWSFIESHATTRHSRTRFISSTNPIHPAGLIPPSSTIPSHLWTKEIKSIRTNGNKQHSEQQSHVVVT